jgi:hypothetical protein
VNELELEIFEQSSDYSEPRPHSREGLRTRGVDRAVHLGLMQEATDPDTGEPRDFASNALRPLWVTPQPATDAG